MGRKTSFDLWAETGEDTVVSEQALQARLDGVEKRIAGLAVDADPSHRLRMDADAADLLLELGRPDQAWERAFGVLPGLVDAGEWETAVEVCDTLFRCERPQSLAALGQGVWLAVTFPVDPMLTLTMLEHVIEETPDDSDGAAVAAATAAYVRELRGHLGDDPALELKSMEMLTTVARRHSGIEDQGAFDGWMKRLELDEPEKFLVRLRNVVDVLVQDEWWFDRESVQAAIPGE